MSANGLAAAARPKLLGEQRGQWKPFRVTDAFVVVNAQQAPRVVSTRRPSWSSPGRSLLLGLVVQVVGALVIWVLVDDWSGRNWSNRDFQEWVTLSVALAVLLAALGGVPTGDEEPLADKIQSVDDGLQEVWPLVSDIFAGVWDKARPPDAATIRAAIRRNSG